MPLFWLRVALAFYGIGLLYAFFALGRRAGGLQRVAMPAIFAGALFHFVSLIEAGRMSGEWAPATLPSAESLLAFLVIAFFIGFWLKYRALSPGVFVFPLVFLLALAAAFGSGAPELSSPLLRTSWIFAHVTLIFLGYAALLLSLVASLLYLVQERRLKAKSPQLWRMPPLETIDEIGYRSLLIGFPFMTLGLVAGSIVAAHDFGAEFFRDPKIVLSFLLWVVYMVLLYTRWNNGWRGRRAAYLATFALIAAVGTWAANYFSGTHRFLGP
jgi:ABC-type uncharacterized transport system permease subunit